MFAVKPMLSRATARRFATLAAPKGSALPPLHKYNKSVKTLWLSDSGTYPIMAIMGCAITFLTGMSINALTNYPDVTIDPKKRNSVLQTWGNEERHTMLERAVGWNSYQKNMPEGLGIDHQKWLEEKKHYHEEASS